MKVVVIGASGQLGTDLVHVCKTRGFDVMPLTHQEIKVEDLDSVKETLLTLKPDVIFNTAAYHVVQKCEEDPASAFAVNAQGALNVARIAEKLNAVTVYFSTDYVFDGQKKLPYVETDRPNPLNVYAATKLEGECYTLNYATRSFVFRISGIYGRVPSRAKGGNFITTMIRLGTERNEVRVVTDEILTPTPTWEIAEKSLFVVHSGSFGLYHLTCEGQCSWYEFAGVIFENLRLPAKLTPTTVSESPMGVRRPQYSVLENARFKELRGPSMPQWRSALEHFLSKHYR